MITDVYTSMSHGHVSQIAYLVEELLCIAFTISVLLSKQLLML